MSKRCSASTCFNCQMTNKSVQYFCYPRHVDFAREWADRAQRPDLMDKPLGNIVKYYLCSGHFGDSSFVDPPHNTKLKRSVRPFSVPLPTIFAPEADFTGLKQPTTAVGYDVQTTPLRQPESTTNTSQSVAVSLQVQRVADEDDDDEDAATVYLQAIDDRHDEMGEELIMDEVKYCQDSVEFLEEIADDACDWTCRLCATRFPATESFIAIFSNGNGNSCQVAADIELVLPNMISKHDDRPQEMCESCCSKTQLTASILREFRAVQEKKFPSN